jgi:hypothetical protein
VNLDFTEPGVSPIAIVGTSVIPNGRQHSQACINEIPSLSSLAQRFIPSSLCIRPRRQTERSQVEISVFSNTHVWLSEIVRSTREKSGMM